MTLPSKLASKLASFDRAKAAKRIEKFIASYVKRASAKGVVIGLSGGLDSAVVAALCFRALGNMKVLGLILPSAATPTQDIEDAIAHARELGIEYKVIDIEPIIEKYMMALPDSKVARGNLTARVRMSILYHHAYVRQSLVVGTSDRSELMIGYFCYDEKTRALTKEGFKDYRQLKLGDIVFSLDLETGQVKEYPVKQVHTFDYDGRMIHLHSRAIDLLVTPNHKMLVHMRTGDGNGVGRLQFRTMEECLKRKKTIFPVPKPWGGLAEGQPNSYHFEFHQKHRAKSADISLDHLFYLFGLFIGDGCCYKGSITVPIRTMLNNQSYMSIVQRDANGRFAQLLTQEHVGNCEKTYDTYEVFFALPEETKYGARTRLTSILSSYGIDFSTSKNTVRISSHEVYSLFSQCGTYAKNKKIPKWILQYPADNLVWLYKGLKDSDGNHSERQDVYYTVSSQLAADYIELCIKIGKLGTFRVRPGKESHIPSQNKRFMTSPSYEISTTKHVNTRIFDNNDAKRVSYKGKIWCPEVPEAHNLLVERNGKLAFCGNSKFGDGAADLLPIAGLYKTQVRALGSYLKLPEAILQKKSGPRLWANHTAEGELGMGYETIDPLLVMLVDRKKTPKQAAAALGVSIAHATKVHEMVKKSAHKRATPPIP